ncbi:MAG: hypothetical protein H0V97_12500 [Actinobacteria bacterium]|nr:hypothetical protein [Actinomycetota bacterium]
MKLVLVSMLVICALALAGPALAQGSDENPPTIGPNQIHRSNPDVLPAFQERGTTTGAGALAFTGSDLVLFALGGAGAVGLGTLAVRASRTRRVEA